MGRSGVGSESKALHSLCCALTDQRRRCSQIRSTLRWSALVIFPGSTACLMMGISALRKA